MGPTSHATRNDAGEVVRARGRRKFVAGALEQAAHILGAVSASVLVAGLVGPYIAALNGSSRISDAMLGEVAGLALGIASVTAATAIVLRGLSRRANDDGGRNLVLHPERGAAQP